MNGIMKEMINYCLQIFYLIAIRKYGGSAAKDMSGKQKYKLGPKARVVRNAQEKNAKAPNKQVYKNKFPVHNLLSLLMAGVIV